MGNHFHDEFVVRLDGKDMGAFEDMIAALSYAASLSEKNQQTSIVSVGSWLRHAIRGWECVGEKDLVRIKDGNVTLL